MPDQPQVECVADVKAVLGEGPVWVASEAALYWVDIKGRKIFRLRADGGFDSIATPSRVGSLAPRAGGGFIAGTDAGLALVDLDSGTFEVIADPEAGIAGNRFNDGKVDRAGRFWAGTMDEGIREASGALYRLDADSSLSVADREYVVANGPAFSADGRRMYHNDSARQVTYVMELDLAGNVLNRREFASFGQDDGFPDGMTVDAEDC
jgi:D-xylonolactonase